jgi:multicomponent Na+:H+ antiporter subunit F
MEGFIPVWVINLSLFMMGLSALLCLYMIARGPTLADRALSLDALTICLIGGISAHSISVDSIEDLTVVLLLAIIGFVGLIVTARYIGGGGDVIDRD